MALDSYTSLKTSIASWLFRPGDSEVSAVVDDFIDLCEEELYQRLRLRSMEYRDSAFSVTSEYTALPTGFIEFRKIKNTASPYQDLQLVNSDFIGQVYGDGATSSTLYYSIEGNQLRVAPISSLTLDVIYYKRFDALSGSVATNDVLTNYPSLYLYGSLKHAAPYFGDDPARWMGQFEQALNTANGSENRARYAGSSPAPMIAFAP